MESVKRTYYQYLVKGRYLNGESFSGVYWHFSPSRLMFELISGGLMIVKSTNLFYGPIEANQCKPEMLQYLKEN